MRQLDLLRHTWFEKHAKSLQIRLDTNQSHGVHVNKFLVGHMFAAGQHVHNDNITLYNQTYKLKQKA
jgi:hypothetical protein